MVAVAEEIIEEVVDVEELETVFEEQDIENIILSIPTNQIQIYTDGSLLKTKNGTKTRAGIYIRVSVRTKRK